MNAPHRPPDPTAPAARIVQAAGACLLLAACAGMPASQAGGRARCDDSALGWAIGQRFDQAVLQRLVRDSGTALVNPIGSTTTVRRDARDDRLRVYLDADNRITAARCE